MFVVCVATCRCSDRIGPMLFFVCVCVYETVAWQYVYQPRHVHCNIKVELCAFGSCVLMWLSSPSTDS